MLGCFKKSAQPCQIFEILVLFWSFFKIRNTILLNTHKHTHVHFRMGFFGIETGLLFIFQGSFLALIVYESVYTYLSILNDTLNGPTPEQYKNGSYFLQQARGKTFPGMS